MMLTNTFLKQMTVTSNDLISVSRLNEYFTVEDEGRNYLKAKMDSNQDRIRKDDFAVEIKNLDLCIHGNRIFDGLSFEVRRGQKIAIIGPSGSGKHSIFKVLLNLF